MLQRAVMTGEELKQAIAKLPRVPFAVVPTPLEECPQLTEALGGPRIFIKRDDLTGLGAIPVWRAPSHRSPDLYLPSQARTFRPAAGPGVKTGV